MNFNIHANDDIRPGGGGHHIGISYRKLLLAMKLTILLFFLFCLHVSASTNAQQITIKVKNVPLENVIEEVHKQSGYAFLYDISFLKKAVPVTINIDHVSVEQALAEIFQNQPFRYEIRNKAIIIKEIDIPETTRQIINNINVAGRVTDSIGRPIPGVSVTIKGSSQGTTTDADGVYHLNNVPINSILIFRMLGYVQKEVNVDSRSEINMVLNVSVSTLNEVRIVNTGYQDVPVERATGSFVKVDSALFNRRVSTNFIDRLEGITSGLIFNRNLSSLDPNASPISIRGRSTIFANTSPLIIVDNFPYDGDLDNINPNDIENITILKDAAAASIWGARAANGVIVVTTKKGKLNQPLQVTIGSNITIGKKPDLFYSPNFLNASDFIDMEQFLYDKGYYTASLNSNSTRPVVTPVVEILAAQTAGTITMAQAQSQINALRNNDVRNDFNKYFYRTSVNQQHAINLSGGGKNATYVFSAGYDQNLSNLVNNDYQRITLNNNSTYSPIKNLELSMGIHFSQNKQDNNNPGINGVTSNGSALYPYARLADNDGNPLAVSKDHPTGFKSAQTGLLDWQYAPLQELNIADNQTHIYDIRINPSLIYKFAPWLSAEVRYQYERQINENDNLRSKDSYYVRNLVNLYSSVSGGVTTRPVPYGDIYDKGLTDFSASIIRGQLNFNKAIGLKNNITAIAGVEYQSELTDINFHRLYGYNENTATSTPVNYASLFPQYANLSASAFIPYLDKFDKMDNEFRSYYSNASYTYDDRYTISGSARYDQSNLFGVNTNQKGVPLWSAGLSWNMGRESFYHVGWLPELKLRATYGINGNIDKALTAYTTGSYAISQVTNAPDVIISNPPNPDLRWEQDKMLNLGVDFGSKNRRISGSFEYYKRIGTDLVGFTAVDPTTGFLSYKGNVADMKGAGIDIQLYTRNLTGMFKWNTSFLFSKTSDEVTKYTPVVTNANHVTNGDGTASGTISVFTPVVGRPVFGVYSYQWAGLDPQTGDPQGYLNGAVSKDYGSIANSKNINDLVYNGPATPTIFGSVRNDFTYRSLTLSVNISYKFGYYFRMPSVNNGRLMGLYDANADYTKRWQKPGDEQTTNVPSLIYPDNTSRDNFYTYSSVLVEKGDHIRLQDIRLSYTLKTVKIGNATLHNLQIYTYANNLGIIWKATKSGIDPDFISGYPNPATLSFGLNVHL
ncbi:MAG TPA: SusC/RagA family TonB-linked outer membrane protein [Mucilaginibacter sp.]|nr:SusC/RagA family TonB-linked outer membrane protein [Mucilaginibacter sp.]